MISIGVSRVGIGMMPLYQIPVSRLYGSLVCVNRDSEDYVVVLVFHGVRTICTGDRVTLETTGVRLASYSACERFASEL